MYRYGQHFFDADVLYFSDISDACATNGHQ
jgi:hypothetical protein